MDNNILRGWQTRSETTSVIAEQNKDKPNYWTSKPSSLVSQSKVESFLVGSGDDIYASILPTLEAAEHEIILVTCFWARSPTLDRLNATLRTLSLKGERLGRPIRVRICFSSLSLFQKLFHTRSLQGHTYPPSVWAKTFGLPRPEELKGLDLEIKSIFVLPFSVMHPKFIIVDRSRLLLPSCNVSWERWFEDCVALTGPVVSQLVQFWQAFWASDIDRSVTIPSQHIPVTIALTPVEALFSAFKPNNPTSTTVFLPSPHHALSIFDSLTSPTSPPTPLNLLITSILQQAKQSIYIQTPNLTAQAVLRELVSALRRGVSIRIVTSRRLMVLEQLVTARTTTARSVRWLCKKHQRLLRDQARHQNRSYDTQADVERGPSSPVGNLSVSFYEPKTGVDTDPVQSHIKLTVADEEMVLLGSGNLDRASWVTSQEVGVAFNNSEFAQLVLRSIGENLEGRVDVVYSA